MKCCLPICLMLLSLFSYNAQGEVNKWVDENNQIHYSDQPLPKNVNATQLKTPAVSASDAPAQKSVAEREADYRKAQKAKEEAEKKEARSQEQAHAKQRYCEDARNNLKTLEDSLRISTYDSKGERVYMDDATRKTRMDEVQKGISTNCN